MVAVLSLVNSELQQNHMVAGLSLVNSELRREHMVAVLSLMVNSGLQQRSYSSCLVFS